MEGTETFEMSDNRKTIWSIYSANSKSLVISSIFCNQCILSTNTVLLHIVYVYYLLLHKESKGHVNVISIRSGKFVGT